MKNIPEPGFYWAKVYGEWQPVRVALGTIGGARMVFAIGQEDDVDIDEWGARLEAPR